MFLLNLYIQYYQLGTIALLAATIGAALWLTKNAAVALLKRRKSERLDTAADAEATTQELLIADLEALKKAREHISKEISEAKIIIADVIYMVESGEHYAAALKYAANRFVSAASAAAVSEEQQKLPVAVYETQTDALPATPTQEEAPVVDASAAASTPVDTAEVEALRVENEKLTRRLKKHKKEYEALELYRDDLLKQLHEMSEALAYEYAKGELMYSIMKNIQEDVLKKTKVYITYQLVDQEQLQFTFMLYDLYDVDGKPASITVKTRLEPQQKTLYVNEGTPMYRRTNVAMYLVKKIADVKRGYNDTGTLRRASAPAASAATASSPLVQSISLSEDPFATWLPHLDFGRSPAVHLFTIRDKQMSVCSSSDVMWGMLHSSDCYILLAVDSTAQVINIHAWFGERSNEDERASTLVHAKRLEKHLLEGKLSEQLSRLPRTVLYHIQWYGHCSAAFINCFQRPVITVNDDGKDIKSMRTLLKRSPRLLSMERTEGDSFQAKYIDCKPDSVACDGVYILDAFHTLYIYAGKKSADEMQRAGVILVESMQKYRDASKELQCDIEPVLDGSSLFWRLVGTVPEDVDKRSQLVEYREGEPDESSIAAVHIVQFDNASPSSSSEDIVTSELHEASALQAAYQSDATVLIDAEALGHIYVRVGAGVSDPEAMPFVIGLLQSYSDRTKRPSWLPITLMTKGQELPAFTDLLSLAIQASSQESPASSPSS